MCLGGSLQSHFFVVLLLVAISPYASEGNAGDSKQQQAGESPATTSRAASVAELRTASDRERAGLRGAVADCVDETTYNQGSQGNWKMAYETKYDADGRTLQHSYTNNDGSRGLETFTYDADGHLLRTVWSGQTGTSGTIYNYDSQGRLVGMTGQGDWTTTIEYDAEGRKSRIVKSTVEGSSGSAHGYAGASIERENVDLFATPPPGGWVSTSFNERNQATESRVYGSTGKLIRRLTRSYDAEGRVADSAFAITDFESLLSPATLQQFASDPEAFEEAQSEFAKILGPEQILMRISYSYDGQGRVSGKTEQLGPAENTVTQISYNDRGDEAREVQTATHDAQPPQKDIVNFDYQYDSQGNWTEKTESSPAANGLPKVWSIERRTITYY